MNKKAQISKKIIYNLVGSIIDEIIQIRRKIHSNPEIMFKEHETASLIRNYLGKLNLQILKPYIETDTVGIIAGAGKDPGANTGANAATGKTILLRADIDALRIEEKTSLEWTSRNKGYAHLCGHDGHTAILLGAVNVLSQLTEYFCGNVKFVFQPAEEGGGGGKILVEKGILDDLPRVDEVYGLHAWPGVKKGCFESCKGTLMSAVDDFSIEIKGKSGHAAMPNLAVDPIVTAAYVITALQTIVSRNSDPIESVVVSITSLQGGTLTNVIPDSVIMKGTLRYFKKEKQEFFRNRIEEVVKGICNANNADYLFNFEPLYIPLVNNPDSVDFLGKVIKNLFGDGFWSNSAVPTTGAEDFAFFLDKRPGAFYRVGLGLDHPSLHNSLFDFDDTILENAILSMCGIALNALGCDISE
ncbi:MAG: amidohydrolase [Spirochaetes bacterium]|nr:amidohydrolase [Spirochaetota bacterium]